MFVLTRAVLCFATLTCFFYLFVLVCPCAIFTYNLAIFLRMYNLKYIVSKWWYQVFQMKELFVFKSMKICSKITTLHCTGECFKMVFTTSPNRVTVEANNHNTSAIKMRKLSRVYSQASQRYAEWPFMGNSIQWL